VLLGLEDHGRTGQPLGRGQDLGRAGLGDAQLGEGVVHALCRPELGQLLVDEAFADRLGHGGEAHLAPQRHQREAAVLALRHQGGRQRRPAPTQLHEQPGRPGVGEAGREPGQPLVVRGERDAGRHHQVAAAQQRADVGQLGGVHPPDLPVEVVGAGQHLGVGAAHGGHLQHVADGEHPDSLPDSLTVRDREYLTDRRAVAVP
jgi:hypothetical protein